MTIHDEIEEVNSRRNWQTILGGGGGLTEEQRKARLVGASDVPAIMGLVPFRNARGPLDTYLDFYGLRTPSPTNERQLKGIALEPVIAQIYAEDTGRELFMAKTQPHPELPFLTVHIDRMVRDPRLVVQIKLVGWRVKHHWEAGIPAYVVAQVTAEMLAWGVDRADVAADIDDQYRRFEMELDPEVGAIVLEQVDLFWRHHIVPMVPPDQPGSRAARDYLLHRYPRAGKTVVKADPEAQKWAMELRQRKATLEQAKQNVEFAREKFMGHIGEEKGFRGEDWSAQWYDVSGRKSTDWKAVQAALVAQGVISREDLDALVAQNIKVGAASRSFRFDDKEQ